MKHLLPISIASKTTAKQCTVDNDSVAIHIFVKGLWDAPTITANIYKNDPQTLAEIIRFLKNSVQQTS